MASRVLLSHRSFPFFGSFGYGRDLSGVIQFGEILFRCEMDVSSGLQIGGICISHGGGGFGLSICFVSFNLYDLYFLPMHVL